MSKEHYHHGDLKKEMIEKGIQLLNEEGIEGFSLRKVAVLCGVSHAAPYKHYKSKDELLSAIVQEVSEHFSTALEKAVLQYPDEPDNQIIELGKFYVQFMVENPDYLKFLFMNPGLCQLASKLNNTTPPDPYQIFKASAIRYLEFLNASPQSREVDILSMWSIVHGYAMLLVNNNIPLSQDYLQIADQMLREKLCFR